MTEGFDARGLAHIAGLVLAGAGSLHMGRPWPRTTPVLLLIAVPLGMLLGFAEPGLHRLFGWALWAAVAMLAALLALPRPHSVPSAVVALLLLGTAHGHAMGMAAMRSLDARVLGLAGASVSSSTLVFIVASAGLYVLGAVAARLCQQRLPLRSGA